VLYIDYEKGGCAGQEDGVVGLGVGGGGGDLSCWNMVWDCVV
jgi:hypothetical protein